MFVHDKQSLSQRRNEQNLEIALLDVTAIRLDLQRAGVDSKSYVEDIDAPCSPSPRSGAGSIRMPPRGALRMPTRYR